MDIASRASGVKAKVAVWRQWFAQRILLPDLSGDAAHALRETIRDEGALTQGYVLMCILSAGIATLGLLQSSPAVVIGAMLVSPLMSPIAALGFGFASFDGKWIRRAARVVATGAVIGIATGMLLTWLSPIDNPTPEIVARTQPTLLDLAVALLSGVAGGYATVRQRGGTAIGVAIATALMPPLATVGYGLGAGRIDFSGGALLLFFTNLAAIAFSFALIARLSGVARPIGDVELTLKHVVVGIAAFLALATPLAATLYRVADEANARRIARDVLTSELGVRDSGIAQLDVRWPLFETLSIDAVVIAPEFRSDAQAVVAERLSGALGHTPRLNLQQVLAADIDSKTRAIVDAALERNAAGIARDVPPHAAILDALGAPVQSIWVDRPARTVNIVPAAAPDWTTRDYRRAEAAATRNGGGWKIAVSPPALTSFRIAFDAGSGELSAAASEEFDNALWALARWRAKRASITVAPATAADGSDVAAARLDFVATRLIEAGVDPVARDVAARDAAADAVVITPLFARPSGPSPADTSGR
jgi:uncharacterized hydrophobic protein (TIGR00271 family)